MSGVGEGEGEVRGGKDDSGRRTPRHVNAGVSKQQDSNELAAADNSQLAQTHTHAHHTLNSRASLSADLFRLRLLFLLRDAGGGHHLIQQRYIFCF